MRLVDPRSNDGNKLVGIQAGPADEGAVHAGLAEEGSGVFRLDAAAVLNRKCLGRFVIEYLTEAAPNKLVRLVTLLGSGMMTGIADSPDRFIRDAQAG